MGNYVAASKVIWFLYGTVGCSMVVKMLEKRFSLSYPFQVARTRDHQCSGVSAIEYAILASLIAIAILTGLSALSIEVSGLYTFVADAIKNAI